MRPDESWWDTTLTKALASLAIALAVTFLPLAIDQVRARRRAKPIRIVAPPANTKPDSVRATVTQDCPVFFELSNVGDATGPPRWDGRWGTCRARGRTWR